WFRTSRVVKKLPSDFDIFSWSTLRNAECIHKFTKGRPSAPSLCAISFSWCGNCRSQPPPWMSNGAPSSRHDIAEHSICQPGRPGADHGGPARLVGLRRLPQHEVERIVLRLAHRHALARAQLVGILARELPVVGKAAHAVVDVAVRPAIGEALLLERGDHLEH